jgi:hypothetical protein
MAFEPHPHVALTAQYNELMSERRVLCFKPAPRLKRRGLDRNHKA